MLDESKAEFVSKRRGKKMKQKLNDADGKLDTPDDKSK